MQITIDVNGQMHDLEIAGRESLLDLLRDQLKLTGTKRECDEGLCGACTVLLDGLPVYACIILAGSCRDRRVETIESLARDGRLDPLQTAFLEQEALQCGYCLPAWLMTLKGSLATAERAGEVELREALAGVRCRCGENERAVAIARQFLSSPAGGAT